MAGLSNEQQETVWALWAKGESIRLIARTIGVSQTPVRTLLVRTSLSRSRATRAVPCSPSAARSRRPALVSKVQPNGSLTPAQGQTKPAPVTTPASPMPHKPAGTPAPAKPVGPQVQTDLVAASDSNTSGELALAGLAVAGIGAGSVVAARRRS